MLEQKRLDRINELSKKAKMIGLTDYEKMEQKSLREAYLKAFRQNFRQQLESIKIVEE